MIVMLCRSQLSAESKTGPLMVGAKAPGEYIREGPRENTRHQAAAGGTR